MTSAFSPKFLSRIEAYPEIVQDSLKRTLDASQIAEITGVLHGKPLSDETKIAGLLDQSLAVDALLSRLMRSDKFLDRMSKVVTRLTNPSASGLPQLAQNVLLPLSDASSPYIYKLREMADTPVEGDPHAATIAMLVAALELFQMLNTHKDRPEAMVVSGIGAGRQPLLPSTLSIMGAPGLSALFPPPPAGLNDDAAAIIARNLYKAAEISPLPAGILKALRRVADHLTAHSDSIALGPFRAVRVAITGDMAKADRDWWADRAAEGLSQPDGGEGGTGRLVLDRPIRPEPVFLAYLGRLSEASPAIALQGATKSLSWEAEIVGYGSFGDLDTVGRFLPDGTTRPPEHALELIEIAQGDANTGDGMMLPSAPLTAETCYAFVVCTDDAATPARYLNAECCMIFDGFDELAETFKAMPRAIRQKPVVVLDRHTPEDAHHIVASVQRHWRYGGLYPTAPVLLTMDAETGRLATHATEGEDLGHMTAAGLATLPLMQALALQEDADTMRRVRAGVLALPDGFVMKCPGAIKADATGLDAMVTRLNAATFEIEDLETMFLSSEVDGSQVAKLSVVTNWPISHLIIHHALTRKERERKLVKLAKKPEPKAAESLLDALAKDRARAPLSTEFDDFAISLSEHPNTLLQIDAAHIATYLRLVRQSRAMDQVAANLMAHTADICELDVDLIIPLFQLFASSLPDATLQASIAFAATTEPERNRMQYRIAESIRCFGSTDLMLQYLNRMKQANEKLTQEPGFRRMFQRLLLTVPEKRLVAALGAPMVNSIRAKLNFNDAFMQAVMAGNRDGMLALLTDADRIRDLEVTKWLDGLRGHSNELREAALPVRSAPLPQLGNLHMLKLMSAVFSDRATLEELRDGGMLDDRSDLSLICHNILGNNDPVNGMLAAQFDGTGLPALQIAGDTIHDSFARAAEMTDQAGRKGKRTTKPLVSVVVSAFNADVPLLKHSIDSALNQSHDAVEVFVIDDESEPGNSAEINALVDGYDTRVRYIRMDENSGPYAGRNRAIALSKGDFIAIQDADDWSHPDRFAQQIAAFEESPLLQLVTTPHIRIDKAGNIQMETRFAILGDGPMTSMFRRSVFDKIGNFAPVRSRGDVEMRERIRGYFGPHTVRELDLPMMLCFADSATLSQKTKGEKREFLQLFRTNISTRRNLRLMRRTGQTLSTDSAIQIPLSLRAPERAMRAAHGAEEDTE